MVVVSWRKLWVGRKQPLPSLLSWHFQFGRSQSLDCCPVQREIFKKPGDCNVCPLISNSIHSGYRSEALSRRVRS